MVIQDKRYLLNLEQFCGCCGETLLREAFGRLDGERRRKTLPMKNAAVKAASTGAGLLVQKALRDYISVQMTAEALPEKSEKQCINGQMTAEALPEIQCFSVEELLSAVGDTVIEPCYKYGGNGKPYFTDYPFYFNLSHSGQYVFCGVSGREIGVDIQKVQKADELRLAKRFFSEEEYTALEGCKEQEIRRQMFFRMWTRKEAYGKLTGHGLTGAIGKDFWTGNSEEHISGTVISGEKIMGMEAQKEGIPETGVHKKEVPGLKALDKKLMWEEYDVLPDYKIACVTRFTDFEDTAVQHYVG